MAIPALRPYQRTANDRVVEAVRSGARIVVLQSPTGSGKTQMACDLVGRAVARDKSVLTLVHRRRLVDQMSERLSEFRISHGVFMRGHKLERSCSVQVASKDTLLERCVRNEYQSLPPASLVVVDEFRHAALSTEYRKLLGHYESRGAVIVGLDATPVAPNGRGLGPWAKALVVAAKVTDLIADKYLVPVKCYAPDRKVVKGRMKRRGIAGDLVQSWKQYACGLPTVLFVSRVEHSRDAVDAFLDEGIPAAHVDAHTPDQERDRVFDSLEDGRIKVVANVGIIKEGVDLPCLGCCQFYMDVQSRVAFIQGAGRILRPSAGKECGILIDHAAAVMRHGFPDEDTEWLLDGNVDENYARLHEDGKTPKALYCKHCERVYSGSLACPECGRLPAKPPRSLFEATPVESEDEMLLEVDRKKMGHGIYSREERIKHWLRCVGVAKARLGTFQMAAMIYKNKYDDWPLDDFPCTPGAGKWHLKVVAVFPDFGRKKIGGT